MKYILKSLIFFLLCLGFLNAQEMIDTRDSTINNLVLPVDIKTTGVGSLGNVSVLGEGEQNVLLIPGWGFDKTVFEIFVNNNVNNYKMHLITLPGFGDTSPQPLPTPNVSYGEQVWTNGCIKGIINYINENNLDEVSVIAYFNIATQIAISLNIEYPDLINKTVIVGGSLAMTDPESTLAPTIKQRIDVNDNYYAPKWFKTVTKEVWDKSNFSTQFYSLDSTNGENLWDKVASVSMPIMIQYLCEFNSQDASLELEKVQKPLLSIIPGYSKDFFESNNQMSSFIKANYITQWEKLNSPNIKVIRIENSGNCIFIDQPNTIDQVISEFLK